MLFSTKAEYGVRLMVELGRLFLLNVGSSFGLAKKLLEILALLDREGVRAIPFKGPTLAVKAYGDLTLRPFSDLDIFVPPGAAEAHRPVHLLAAPRAVRHLRRARRSPR